MLSVVIGYIFSISIAILLFILFKYTLLKSININKWMLLLITIVILVIPVIGKIYILNSIWQYLHAVLFLFFALWFMHESGFNFDIFSKNNKKLMIIEKKNYKKK